MADEKSFPAGTNGGVAAMARNVWRFYADGFRGMTIGRTLWILILIKIFILFFIFRLFFFPDILSRDYDTDEERAAAVRKSLIDNRFNNF